MAINSTARGLDWQKATTEKKLEFLYGWCETLENMMVSNRHEAITRLNRIDAVIKEGGKAPG